MPRKTDSGARQFSFDHKLQRADQHLLALKEEIHKWRTTRPYTIVDEIERETGDNVVKFKRIEPPPQTITQLVGDALHNLRCTLDYLVYSLATDYSGTLSDREATRTAFPIFGSQDDFEKSGKRKIQFVSPEAQSIIGELQPYHAGYAVSAQWLWLLRSSRTWISIANFCSRSVCSEESMRTFLLSRALKKLNSASLT